MRDGGRQGSPKRPHAGGERGESRGRASQPGPTQTLAPQPALLEAEDAHFGEDVHQVAVAEPAVLAGAAPPPAGRRPVPVLLPCLPLLADQAAGDGRGHGGPGTGSGGGRGREKGAGDTGAGRAGEEGRPEGPGAGSAQSRLGPIVLSAERGAGPANAPGARRGERREPEVVPAAAVASDPGLGPGPRAPPLAPPSCPARLPGGR